MSNRALFPTFINQSEKIFTPIFNNRLRKEIYQIKKRDLNGVKWSEENYFAGYTSFALKEKLHLGSPNFIFFEKVISQKIAKFARFLDWDVSPKYLKMDKCWVNIMPRGAHHTFHIHPHAVLSGTYYVDVPKNSGPLTFEDPRVPMMMLSPRKKLNCKVSNENFISILPKARDLVLFESWLRHEVPANQSEKDRISVSFNYGVR